MSKVSYLVGKETFAFQTDKRITSDEYLFQLEEQLMEEIREHKLRLNPQPQSGYIHHVIFEDDNGTTAFIKDFIKQGNLEIIKKV